MNYAIASNRQMLGKASHSIALAFLCVLLSSCERSWHFTIVDLEDLSHPEMCISTEANCNGDPVYAAIISLDELDASGNSIKTVWAMQAINSAPLKNFTYGTAPSGWRELMPATPIEPEKRYRIGMHTFSCHKERGCLVE